MFTYVQRVFTKYATFTGRAQRAEYWYFYLFNILAYIAISLVFGFISNRLAGVASALYALAIFMPALAVAVRRLHDTDRSGWWVLISLIPLIGGVWLVVLLVLDSTPGDNRFGPNPKQITTVDPVSDQSTPPPTV